MSEPLPVSWVIVVTPDEVRSLRRPPYTFQTFVTHVNKVLLEAWTKDELGTGTNPFPQGRSLAVPPELSSADVRELLASYTGNGWRAALEIQGDFRGIRFWLPPETPWQSIQRVSRDAALAAEDEAKARAAAAWDADLEAAKKEIVAAGGDPVAIGKHFAALVEEAKPGILAAELRRKLADVITRTEAATFILDAKNPEHRPLLVEALQAAAHGTKSALVWALAGFDCRDILPLIVRLLADPNYGTRQQALHLIEKQASDDADVERCRAGLREVLRTGRRTEELLGLADAIKEPVPPLAPRGENRLTFDDDEEGRPFVLDDDERPF